MKSLIVGKDLHLSVREIPKPECGQYQALVKVLACGVCNGTDMKIIHGRFKNIRDYPVLLGHEAVGEVVETGERVRYLKKGDLVLLPFLYGERAEGYPAWGAFSEYALVGDAKACEEDGYGNRSQWLDDSYYAQTVLTKEDKVSAVEAVMIITFREVLSAIRRFGFGPDESVVIFGAGPVGLCFTRFAKLLGMGRVITVDIEEEKIAFAKTMGADEVINSRQEDVTARVRAILGGGADYVVDAVGRNELINDAMGLIRDHGKICGYGISPKLSADIDWSGAPYNWTLQFVQFPEKKEEAQAHSQIMAWINSGVLKPGDFISHIFPAADILEAFSLVERREPGMRKVVVEYGGADSERDGREDEA